MDDIITVIMSIYNEPVEFIEASLKSITMQTYKSLQIIVVIDNPENYAAVEFLRVFSNEDERIQLIFNEKNEGLVFSLNRAIGVAKGKYIARMDADDISKPDRLERQLQFLTTNALDIVGANIEYIDDKGNIIKSKSQYPSDDTRIKRYLYFRDCIPHPTWLATKNVYVNLSGYRPIDACEDYDFLLRASINGYKMGNYPGTVLFYRLNKNGITTTKHSIQCTSHYIIRKAYRKKQIISLESYRLFMDSRQGEKIKKTYDRYFEMIDKEREKHKAKFSKLLYRLSLLIINKASRQAAFDWIMCSLIK